MGDGGVWVVVGRGVGRLCGWWGMDDGGVWVIVECG